MRSIVCLFFLFDVTLGTGITRARLEARAAVLPHIVRVAGALHMMSRKVYGIPALTRISREQLGRPAGPFPKSLSRRHLVACHRPASGEFGPVKIWRTA